MEPDHVWQGPIAFHEMLFGSWIAYVTLVLIWEKLLKTNLPEWKYILLLVSGASFFVINHYYNFAPFYAWLIGSYSVAYYLLWYWLGLRNDAKSLAWKILGIAYALIFTVLFVGYELSARFIVANGVHESWVLAAAFAGVMVVTYKRGRILNDRAP
jgi:hypothetical protein